MSIVVSEYRGDVSIPLWFDSNRRHGHPHFPTRHVSIPLWFDSNSNLISLSHPPYCSFNSTLVRFKRYFGLAGGQTFQVSIPLWFDSNGLFCPDAGGQVRFQFHSGSIQTGKDTLDSEGTNGFQFHSGSIQTCNVHCRCRFLLAVSIPLWFDSNLAARAFLLCGLGSFNSTLVRFKLACSRVEGEAVPCFNSTLVRFKHSARKDAEWLSLCFNSTLVRFKLCLAGGGVASSWTFQFHSGSIQTWKVADRKKELEKSFNSTLVRFKPAAFASPRWSATEFQFHSGSIQTSSDALLVCFPREVSIPLWFDSNRSKGKAIRVREYGFNSTLVRFKLIAPLLLLVCNWRVSIPLWFDSNTISTEQGGTLEEVFQFHSGSIQTQHIDTILYQAIMFQFHSGSIQTEHWHELSASWSMFQFHSGSIQTWRHAVISIHTVCFNSTLVRFKPSSSSILSFDSSMFQFHSGSIQTLTRPGQFPVTCCFNSTLVRFKLQRLHKVLERLCRFQFHSGSIQTTFSDPS